MSYNDNIDRLGGHGMKMRLEAHFTMVNSKALLVEYIAKDELFAKYLDDANIIVHSIKCGGSSRGNVSEKVVDDDMWSW
jgi:hypothetical protein